MDIAAGIDNHDFDGIEPCRACGIYFTMEQAMIRPIFGETTGDATNMTEIVKQMSAWKIEVTPEDGRPQFMCFACISEFQKLLKFKLSCVETHEQFSDIEYKRLHNDIVIKTEIEPEEEQFCGFVYLDTDEEEAGSEEDGSARVCAPFDIPHVPIKEEHMARVPQEISTTQYRPPAAPKVADILPQSETSLQPMKCDMLAPLSTTMTTVIEDSDDDEEIIKFTYDDEANEALPAPLLEPPKKWYCKLCTHESQTQELHLQHMQRIHTLRDCECHICGKKFSNATDTRLKFHMKWHKLNKHLKCAICGFFCNSKDTLKEHKIAVHTRVQCKYCSKRMKPKALQMHLNQHLQLLEAELVEKQASQSSSNAELPSSSHKIVPDVASNSSVHEAVAINSNATMSAISGCIAAPAEIVTDILDAPVSSVAIASALQLSEIEIPTANGSSSVINLAAASPNTSSEDDIFEQFAIEQKGRSSKALSNCHICDKAFDLQIKLNRHLQKAHKA